MNGKKIWVIPDGYMSNTKSGEYISHEAVCVLNLTETDAEVKLTIFFEDRDPMCGFVAECKSKRTHHVRLDKIVHDKGEKIPTDVPYAIFVESNVDVICQHTRMDVSDPNITLMSTIAY